MVVRKMTLVIAIVVAVALRCAQAQTPTSIQLRFLDPVPTSAASEADDANTRIDVGLPIQLELTPPDALLQSSITLTVSTISGSATGGGSCPNAPIPPFNGVDFCFITNIVDFAVGANDGNIITVIIDGLDDRVVEGPESFTASAAITDPGTGVPPQFVPGTDTVTISIADDDVAFIRFRESAYSVDEPNGPLLVDLVLDQITGGGFGAASLSQQIIVQVNAFVQAGDTATEGAAGDFIGVTCTTTFAAGSGVGAVSTPPCEIPINDDSIPEGDETFSLNSTIINNNGQSVLFSTGGDSASATIIDDDLVPLNLHFSANTFNAQEGIPTVAVCVTADNPADIGGRVIPVNVSATPVTAQGGGVDYGPIPAACTPLVFTSTTTNPLCCNIPINDDNLVEFTETFNVFLTSTSSDANLIAPTQAVVSIADNDNVFLRFSQSAYSQSESVTPLSVSLVVDSFGGTGTGPSSIADNIDATITAFVQVGDTATEGAGGDFIGITCPVTFISGSGLGSSSQPACSITLNNDNIFENAEVFSLSAGITNNNGLSAQFSSGGNSASATILDNEFVTVELISMDPSGLVGLPDVAVPENGLDPRLCVRLAGGVTIDSRTVTVNLATVAGGTATVNMDYSPINSPITFTSLNQNQALCRDIPVTDDLICEADETIAVSLTTAESQVSLNPSSAIVTIIDNDVVTVGFDMTSYSVTEFSDPQLNFNVQIVGGQKGPGRSCVVTVSTLSATATSPEDFDEIATVVTLSDGTQSVPLSVNIVDDLIFEQTEHFNISLSTNSDGCSISDDIADVYIFDDEDCPNPTGAPCDENADCGELRGPNNFTCTCFPFFVGDGFMCRPERMVGDDPHFSIVLPSGKLLCYTVQGEHGFVFNLISNKKLSINAMFVPDSRREEVTWLGSMGIVVRNSGYKTSNATYLRFETKGKKIYIGDKVVLEAKNIEKLSFNNGKLTISEAPPTESFKYPSVDIDLCDVGLNFTIKFMNEHLDLFWHSTGHETKDSHGLIGQFFRKEVEVDTVRKILILPGKEPVPVMRRPVWSFMEREVADDQLCWTAMNPGYQGQGLIDGSYLDYLVNDVFSTDFKFKKRQ